jgi:hypothetical protein
MEDLQAEKTNFLSKNEGCPSYRRSLLPSKGEHPALQNTSNNFFIFIYFVGRVCTPGSGYQCGSGSTKQLETIQNVTIHYRKINYPEKPLDLRIKTAVFSLYEVMWTYL